MNDGNGRETAWARGGDVLWRHSARGLVLKRWSADEITTLTGTGPDLWHELAQPLTLAALGCRLAERFGVAEEQVIAEVLPVLADLERRQLVLRHCA